MKFKCTLDQEDYLLVEDGMTIGTIAFRVKEGSHTSSILLTSENASKMYETFMRQPTDQIDFKLPCRVSEDDYIQFRWLKGFGEMAVVGVMEGKKAEVLLPMRAVERIHGHLGKLLNDEAIQGEEMPKREGYDFNVTAFDGATLDAGYNDESLSQPIVRMVAEYQNNRPIFVHVRLGDFVRLAGKVFEQANNSEGFDGEIDLIYTYTVDVPATKESKIEVLA